MQHQPGTPDPEEPGFLHGSRNSADHCYILGCERETLHESEH